MFIVLKKTYTITVTIQEGDDEFWEDLRKQKKSGCDEIVDRVRQALADDGFQEGYGTSVRLERFEEEAPQ